MPEENGVCAIVPSDQDGFQPHVYGMGILVNKREIITCAHVINQVLGPSWQTYSEEAVVRICFPLAEGSPCIHGSVDRRRWFAPGEPGSGSLSDIAVIQLSEDAPSAVGRAVLKKHVEHNEVEVFGFREKDLPDGGWRSHPQGEWATDYEIGGPLPGGRAQINGLLTTGAAVEKGYSGAGVYDLRGDAVVGMIVEADREKERRIAQFIDVPSLEKALGIAGTAGPASPLSGRQRTVPLALVTQAKKMKLEIEASLEKIVESMSAPDPDAGLTTYLESLLADDNLRTAFGLPKAAEKARVLFDLVSSAEPSMQPFLGILAQRINHLLWRLEFTLDTIPGEWPEKAKVVSRAVRSICEPYLLARQPTLLDLSAALELEGDLKAFNESAPDPTLYAVLRAFDHAQSHVLPVEHERIERVRTLALDFLANYLESLVAGRRQVDDSSNAWWAVRTGLRAGGARFRDLLPRVAAKFNDVKVPPADVARLAAVPEIYKPISTASYTLSNVQDIFESRLPMDAALVERMHGIITAMAERLLATPPSRQLYLASVHQEGLRNFLDYIEDQKLPVT
ncbi:MAG TPA: trypsin-like peptidase domain-containing protein [Thermoanaerobaculia bacterium]|nr:trypsin-like peptidase domain-containing protein [Thermoanaerobaculia bacterium]